jgi:hypothetical protein
MMIVAIYLLTNVQSKYEPYVYLIHYPCCTISIYFLSKYMTMNEVYIWIAFIVILIMIF